MRISFKAKVADEAVSAVDGGIYYVPEINSLHFFRKKGDSWVVNLDGFDVTIHEDDKFAHPAFAAGGSAGQPAEVAPLELVVGESILPVSVVAELLARFAKEVQQ